MRRFLFALALSVVACDTTAPPSDTAPIRVDGVELAADRDRYSRGDEAALTLRNDGGTEYWTGVVECAVLERWTGSGWVMSASGNDRACIEIAVRLGPGDELTGIVPLDVPGGSYRLTHGVYGDDREHVATAAFRVE